jgi:hypothetical protein
MLEAWESHFGSRLSTIFMTGQFYELFSTLPPTDSSAIMNSNLHELDLTFSTSDTLSCNLRREKFVLTKKELDEGIEKSDSKFPVRDLASQYPAIEFFGTLCE